MSEAPSGTPTESRSVWTASAALFEQWREGEARALDDLVRLLSPVLWQVVRATGLDRETAEDVVQTTWLSLVDHADAISSAQAVSAWLCTSARREAWRVGKAATRTRPAEDEVIAHRLPTQPGPEGAVVARDEGDRLWAALEHLPERCQKLLRIVAATPRPDYTEVASVLEMPVGSVGPTRGRCLEKLRRELTLAGGAR